MQKFQGGNVCLGWMIFASHSGFLPGEKKCCSGKLQANWKHRIPEPLWKYVLKIPSSQQILRLRDTRTSGWNRCKLYCWQYLTCPEPNLLPSVQREVGGTIILGSLRKEICLLLWRMYFFFTFGLILWCSAFTPSSVLRGYFCWYSGFTIHSVLRHNSLPYPVCGQYCWGSKLGLALYLYTISPIHHIKIFALARTLIVNFH